MSGTLLICIIIAIVSAVFASVGVRDKNYPLLASCFFIFVFNLNVGFIILCGGGIYREDSTRCLVYKVTRGEYNTLVEFNGGIITTDEIKAYKSDDRNIAVYKITKYNNYNKVIKSSYVLSVVNNGKELTKEN